MEIEVIEMPDKKEVYGDADPYTEEGFAIFRKWLKDNGVTYYGKPKEDFFMSEAYALAKKEGNTKLIADNLS